MRVPLSWLRELVAVEASTDDLADRLSRSGTSVEAIHRLGGSVSGVVAARVLEVEPIPEARKPMWHGEVDAGSARYRVVAGAPVAAGDVVPFAQPGARVAVLDEPIGVRTMLGRYPSQGMMCSAYELGLGEDHSGILRLDPDTPLGTDVALLLGLDDDVLELEITPNRPDLLSVLGVAREVAVLYGLPLRQPDTAPVAEGRPAGEMTSVTIEDPDGCPRYLARIVEDVTFGPAPALVQARLVACGIRPLGNIVDATNYVLELTGQPLHAFDLDKLGGQRIVVRRARSGEKLVTLDDVERKLEPSDLVIADTTDAQALAGVMGGAATEVGPGTSRVLIESAYFEPKGIYRTSRRADLRTGASQRFEKGTDPQMVAPAADLCAELIRRWAGGRVARGSVDVGGVPERPTIRLRRSRVRLFMGFDLPAAEQDRILTGLGCGLASTPETVDAAVPSWRPDLEREIDLVEEIARVHGYDAVPVRVPHGPRGGLSGAQVLRRRVRDVLLGAGLSEATLSSFLSAEQLEAVGEPGSLEIANPLTSEQTHLRPSLLPGLLAAARHNAARGVRAVRLFEIGTVFGGWPPGAELPREIERAGAILHGGRTAWHRPARPPDAWDAKGLVELVLDELGVRGWTLGACDHPAYHPGRSATVLVEELECGRFGELRPGVIRAHDLEGPVAVMELELGPLFDRAPDGLQVRDIPQLPPVLRDLNLSVDESVAAGDLRAVILAAAGPHLESAELIEVYRGDPLPAGRKSLVWRLTFRAPDRTLTADEADAAREAIVRAAAERTGAEAR